jgi:L-iditol 2-dehydrogenase
MKAAVITNVNELQVTEVPDPVAGPGEVIVRMRGAGLCTWEQRAYTGQQKVAFPFLGGHENAGEVVEIGPGVTHVRVGDRVTLGPTSCGMCESCFRGEDKNCAEHFATFSLKGGDIGPGGFAEYKMHRADGCYNVGDAEWDVASLAEPLSCAVHAARLSGAMLGERAVVFGAGTMGLMNQLVLQASGLSVVMVDPEPGRRDKALSLGATAALDATDDVVEHIKDLTLGGANIAVAAVGSDSVNHTAYDALAPRGRLCMFASAHPMTPFAINPNHVHNAETQIIGAVSADRRDHWTATRLIAEHRIDLQPLVSRRFSLAEAQDAFDYALTEHPYRVIIEP